MAGGEDKGEFIYAHRLVCSHTHYAQIYGIEGKLSENTGQNNGNAKLCVQKSGNKTGQNTGQQRRQHGHPHILPCENKHHSHSAARGKRAVNCKVSHVQQPEGYIYAKGHKSPYYTLRNAAGHVFEQPQYIQGGEVSCNSQGFILLSQRNLRESQCRGSRSLLHCTSW